MHIGAADQLKTAIEAQHGGRAIFVRSVPVHHSLRGKTLWNGAVQVFDLADNAQGAIRAYAWSQGSADGQRRFFIITDSETVTGPREAVSAFLATDGASGA